MKRDKDTYVYHLVPIRKGSLAEAGLLRDAAKHGYRHPATLIAALIADRYEKLDGGANGPGLWFPDMQALQVAMGMIQPTQPMPVIRPAAEEDRDADALEVGTISQAQMQAMDANVSSLFDELDI